MSSTINTKDIVFDEESSAPSPVPSSIPTSNIAFEEEPSTASDIGRGLAQGLTFGFSDEALAALKAAYEVATTKKELKDLPSLYRQLQQIEQKKVAEARERSPALYTTGEIAGAIAPAFFTAGLGAAGAGARAGGALAAEGATLAQTAAKALPGAVTEGAAAAPGFLKSILGAAKAGATYGGIAAAGTTEKPIEETGQFIREVGKGALGGAVVGGAITAGLKGAGALGKKILPEEKDYAFLRQTKKAFEEARGEAPAFGEAAVKQQLERERGAAEKLASTLMEAKESAGKEIASVLEKAEMPLYSSDFSRIISALGKEIPPDTRKFLFDYGQKLEQGTLTASELNEVKKLLKETTQKYGEKLLPKSLDALEKLQKRAEDLLETVPGYKQAVQRYHSFLEAVPETITEKGLPPEFRKRYLSEIAAPKTELFKELEGMIRTIGKPGTSADERTKTLFALEKNIKALGEKDPEIYKTLGFDEKAFTEAIRQEADLSAISQARRGYEPQTGLVRQLFNLLTPRGATFTGAAFLGKTVGKIERSAPAQLASKVYSSSEPQLRKLSEWLMSKPVGRRFGENLAASLDKPGGIPSRAVLFSIMQDPTAREAISDFYSESGEQ